MEWILGLHRCRLVERGVYLGMKIDRNPSFALFRFSIFLVETRSMFGKVGIKNGIKINMHV